jgi:hypothetical protein
MTPYQVNPYVSFIESRLFSDSIQYAVFHRLTNEIIEPSETVRSLLHAAKLGNRISLSDAQLGQLGETGVELKQRSFESLTQSLFGSPFAKPGGGVPTERAVDSQPNLNGALRLFAQAQRNAGGD